MKNIGLELSDIQKIRNIFSKFPQIEQVILFGSRAMGNFKPSSDIDLTLKGNSIDLSTLQEIEFEIDDLLLPYKFDLILFKNITNSDLIDHINMYGVEFYKNK